MSDLNAHLRKEGVIEEDKTIIDGNLFHSKK